MIKDQEIKAIGLEYLNLFSDLAADGAKSLREWKIRCADIEKKYLSNDIRDSEQFSDIFEGLSKIENNPCIYYFEIITDISNEIIIESFKDCLDRSKPALKSVSNDSSRILYVGKVNSKLWGRVIEHFGCHTHKNGSISNRHGLQLMHWASDLELELKLHVLEFDTSYVHTMELLESHIAKKLSPIIGKHR